jgi:hypothetical protein
MQIEMRVCSCGATFAAVPGVEACSLACAADARGHRSGQRKPSARRSTTSRGYGAAHQRKREEWEPLVDAGLVECWRCEELIDPGEPWDLGHDDDDRSLYRGPEHRTCNRSAPWHRGE